MRRCCIFFIAFLMAISLFVATGGYESQGPDQPNAALAIRNPERDSDHSDEPREAFLGLDGQSPAQNKTP